MQLLPDAITHRVASRVQAHADGVVSNVGNIPAHVAQLGPYTAQEVFLLAGPMRTDITVCMGRDRSDATLGVVADPARLGPVGSLRDRVAEELAAWGVDADMR
jgi:diacylglycerol O-acyltransferase